MTWVKNRNLRGVASILTQIWGYLGARIISPLAYNPRAPTGGLHDLCTTILTTLNIYSSVFDANPIGDANRLLGSIPRNSAELFQQLNGRNRKKTTTHKPRWLVGACTLVAIKSHGRKTISWRYLRRRAHRQAIHLQAMALSIAMPVIRVSFWNRFFDREQSHRRQVRRFFLLPRSAKT